MSLFLLSIVDNIGSGKTIESSSIDIKVCDKHKNEQNQSNQPRIPIWRNVTRRLFRISKSNSQDINLKWV
jgi:ribosomal protein L18E